MTSEDFAAHMGYVLEVQFSGLILELDGVKMLRNQS